MEGVVLSPFYLFHLNITCFPSWEQLLKERAAISGTLFPVFFLRHYFILPFEGGFVSFHFDAKHLKALSGTVTLGVAQAGMLDLSTEGAYYMQTAVRPPAAAPAEVKPLPKAKKPTAKAKQSKKTAEKKAA